MEIAITWGKGKGSTGASAFDSSLWDAGVANFNIVYLSSIIPYGAIVKVKKVNYNLQGKGNKLYAVVAKVVESRKGKKAWCGIGWIIEKNNKGGIFVEHHGFSLEEVNCFINRSLKEMAESRKYRSGKINKKIISITCKGKPVCAVVCAVFKNEGW